MILGVAGCGGAIPPYLPSSVDPERGYCVAIVTDDLFALVGHVGTHGGEPPQRIKGLFALSVLGPVLHTNNTSYQNRWIDEASSLRPYTYKITRYPDVGNKRGLGRGMSYVWRTDKGRGKRGYSILQKQHPGTLGIAGRGGLYATGQPIAEGRGSNFCKILSNYLKHYNPVTGNIGSLLPSGSTGLKGKTGTGRVSNFVDKILYFL
jgi:hypothetical protein